MEGQSSDTSKTGTPRQPKLVLLSARTSLQGDTGCLLSHPIERLQPLRVAYHKPTHPVPRSMILYELVGAELSQCAKGKSHAPSESHHFCRSTAMTGSKAPLEHIVDGVRLVPGCDRESWPQRMCVPSCKANTLERSPATRASHTQGIRTTASLKVDVHFPRRQSTLRSQPLALFQKVSRQRCAIIWSFCEYECRQRSAS